MPRPASDQTTQAVESLTPPSEALLKRQSLLEHDAIVVWPPADGLAAKLNLADRSISIDTASAAGQFLKTWPVERVTSISHVEGISQAGFADLAAGRQLCIFMTKAKLAIAVLLSGVARELIRRDDAAVTEVLIIGEKRSGIASFAESLVRAGLTASKLDSLRHCQIWSLTLDPVSESLQRWLDDTGDAMKEISLSSPLNDATIKLNTHPGVFSHGSLDEGTSLLLKALGDLVGSGHAMQSGARILDFGCGNGPVSAVLASYDPTLRLTAIDTSLAACVATATNLAVSGLNAEVLLSHGIEPLLADGRGGGYDWVVTNPPFHDGLRRSLDSTLGMFRNLSALLQPDGSMLLVANHFLPYQAFLREHGFESRLLIETSKFIVLQVKQPRPSRR